MANLRFAVGLQRLLPLIQIQHMLMFLIAVAWIAACQYMSYVYTSALVVLMPRTALLLAGCTTNTGSMSGIYLLSIHYATSTSPSTPTTSLFAQAAEGGRATVRAGYFGLCAKTTDTGEWICAGSASGLNAVLVDRSNDPLNAIAIAGHFKGDVVFPGLLIGAVALTAFAFVLLVTFPGWHEEHDARTGSEIDIRPFPSRPVSQLAAFFLIMASLFTLAAAIWQHVAAAASATLLSTTTQEFLACDPGPAAMALAWISFAVIVVASFALVNMINSIHLLDKLTDD